ncbi:hypothetical protein ABBQ38_005170 [Trebouxia sp. C0009 RCD-2024]
MTHLSDRALQGLKQYQYKSGGYTLLDNFHTPIWNGIVELLPLWLAPNLITLIGVSALVVAYVVTLFYLPGLAGSGPWWLYYLNGFSVFWYLHLDCLDGKQARRTKSSSPLGQLFDHGVDALSVHLILTVIAATLSIGISWKAVVGSLGIMIPWQLAHWEEYHTGMLFYGTKYWGITEANYLLVLLHIMTGILGPEIWIADVAAMLNLKLPFTLLLNDCLLVFIAFFAISYSSAAFYRVLNVDQVALPPQERGHKALGRGNAIGHLISLQTVNTIGGVMLFLCLKSPTAAPAVNAIFGIIYAQQSTKLIIDHMSKEPFSVLLWPVLAMAVVSANALLNIVQFELSCWVVAVVVVGGYITYIVQNINEICRYLGINCLTLRHLDNAAK